ncbi:unnamed protein product [Aphanomyces euteiches]
MHTNAMLQLRVNQLQEDAIQEDAKEDDEQHWTMGYPVLRGLLVGMQSVWHTMVSCTAQWFASWTSSSSPDDECPDDVSPEDVSPDVVSNAFPSFASSDDNGSVDFSLSNYEPPEDTENRVDELSPVDAQPHVVVQDNVSVMDGQPSSVQRHECIHGLMAGIHSVWLVWLRTMSCTLSWTRGETIRRHPIVVPTARMDHRVVPTRMALESATRKSPIPVVAVSHLHDDADTQHVDDGDVVRLAWCTLYLVLYLFLLPF